MENRGIGITFVGGLFIVAVIVAAVLVVRYLNENTTQPKKQQETRSPI